MRRSIIYNSFRGRRFRAKSSVNVRVSTRRRARGYGDVDQSSAPEAPAAESFLRLLRLRFSGDRRRTSGDGATVAGRCKTVGLDAMR